MAAPSFDAYLSAIPKTPALTQAPNSASTTQVDTIFDKIADAKGIDKTNGDNIDAIKTITCSLLQLGAASPKFDPNRSYTINGITIDNKTLKKAINDTNASLTPRKLARSLRDEIGAVATQLDIPGNLSKNYLLSHPNAQMSELIWASDFQTFSNNPSIPTEVKEWLLDNYNTRFKKK